MLFVVCCVSCYAYVVSLYCMVVMLFVACCLFFNSNVRFVFLRLIGFVCVIVCLFVVFVCCCVLRVWEVLFA